MGLLKNFFKPNPARHEQKGDACVRASDWGMAIMAYGAALNILEKTAPEEVEARQRVLEKLQGSKETLARQHVETAIEFMESGHNEDAGELLKLALDLAQDRALRKEIKDRLVRVDHPTSIDPQQDAAESLTLPTADEQESAGGGDEETFTALCGVLPEEVRSAYASYGLSFRRGYLALNRGEFAFAADALSQAMEEDSSPDSYITLELATALLNLQRLDEARELLETFLEHHPEALPGYQALCEVFWEMKAFDLAEELLETCPDELKNSLAYVLMRGESLSQAGRHSQAVDFYQGFINQYGRHEAVLKALAGSYETLENLEEARKLYSEIMTQCQSCHGSADLLVQRKYADISFALNERSTKILELYLSLAQEDPFNQPLYFQRVSEIYAAMGNQEEARRFRLFFQQATEEKE
ncbi:MAG: tetratricopeptide repeat protein [Desulfatiglans sp.]|jgi:tetratricopeptide (TPR) repeat protein|nr:tetratricopeptide repeat protein [Thermodesulfobacteriota bacterium]MEE4351371.1 tetratricopeptide repeat protein [Desulfatiglans sp.]